MPPKKHPSLRGDHTENNEADKGACMRTWDHLGRPLFVPRVEGIGVESAMKIMRLKQKGIIDDVFGWTLTNPWAEQKEGK